MAQPEFLQNLYKALEIVNEDRKKTQLSLVVDETTVDSQLYSNFIPDSDKKTCQELHDAQPDQISQFTGEFHDERLKILLPLYKARNFYNQLTSEEIENWERYRTNLLMSGGPSGRFARVLSRLDELYQQSELGDDKRFLLDELKLWYERIAP